MVFFGWVKALKTWSALANNFVFKMWRISTKEFLRKSAGRLQEMFLLLG